MNHEAIVRTFADEIRRRPCPKCSRPLFNAAVTVTICGGDVELEFWCPWCAYTNHGSAELTRQVLDEVSRYWRQNYMGPIDVDEVLDLQLLSPDSFADVWKAALA